MNRVDCPFCQGIRTIGGTLADNEGTINFTPEGVNMWKLLPSYSFPVEPRACLTCGQVWLVLDPVGLVEWLKKHGTQEMKQRLGT